MKAAGIPVIDEVGIQHALEKSHGGSAPKIRDILAKAMELRGLSAADVAELAAVNDPGMLEEVFDAARKLKNIIYGQRLVIFAPLYISNLCRNHCLYCAFSAQNPLIKRRALTQEEIARGVTILLTQGHKRVLLVAGESSAEEGLPYVLESIDTIYRTKAGASGVRRVNVNVAPLTVEGFRQLHERQIGTYQLFQETYHRETYAHMHLSGPKADYDWRIGVMDRAMEAGIQDVGIGALFGLYDWRFEILALLQHAEHLERKFGVGPHTISVPRLEPATGSEVSVHPPHLLGDVDFRKLIAILRLAVPYTGIIMSTRENPAVRRESFALGVSQISAGSRTNPGGYAEDNPDLELSGQFSLGDHRTLDEVVRDIASLGYIPSFCTGCYRLGRTGADFMDLAKPGAIQEHCRPNAIATCLEYLLDYASPETRAEGEGLISRLMAEMEEGSAKHATERMTKAIREGRRDVYV
ncbi:MAG: [FeFe] hydrogenase H-cluster radical SAM maturase HydG [Planctomycetes bacterium]|nr:[FeFe] hydrogenase H-cluster radical SAM maturase HydG [Planctomycetota bacterium]